MLALFWILSYYLFLTQVVAPVVEFIPECICITYSGEYACSQWLLFTHILHPCFGVIFVELARLLGVGGWGQYPIMKNVSLS